MVAVEPAESEYSDWESQSRPIATVLGVGVADTEGVGGSCMGKLEGCWPDCTILLVEGDLKEERRPALDFLRIVGLELILPCG